MIKVVFKEYNIQATEFALNLVLNSDLNTAYSFFKAYDNTIEKFGFKPQIHYYQDLTRIVSNYIL
jgi:hypothetical protein